MRACCGLALFLLASILSGISPIESGSVSSPTPTPAAAPSSDVCKSVRKASDQANMLQSILGQYNSIGFVSLDLVASQAQPSPGSCGIRYGNMINMMGKEVPPTVDTIRASVLVGPSTCPGFGLCADIFDTVASTGWPISFLSYLAIPTKLVDTCATSTTFDPSCTRCLRQKTVYDYVSWILTSPDASEVLHASSMATLPAYVVTRIQRELLPNIRCAGADGNYTAASRWPAVEQAARIKGGGSSVQASTQAALANAFNIDTSVSISFLNPDPAANQLATGAIDFESRDAPFDPTLAGGAAAAQEHVMIPIMAAGVVPVYNLERYRPITFSRTALSGMFLGTLTSWSDPALAPASGPPLPSEAPVRFVSGSDVEETGVPSTFVHAIRSFANLSAGDGPDPAVPSSQQKWPDQTAYAHGEACRDKPCSRRVCDPGTYFDVEANACAECPVGYFAISAGSLSCEPCPAGTYAGARGSRGCGKCDDVSYQPDTASSSCLPCPANTRRYGVPTNAELAAAGPNASAARIFGVRRAECLCLPGFWLPEAVNASGAGGLACLACPEGATCAGFADGEQTIPRSKMNFWGDPDNPSAFFECPVGHCLANYSCAEGRAGRFCAQPAPGYYMLAGDVRECGAETAAVQVVLTLLEVVAWIVMVNFACSQYHSLSVDMMMLQTSGYIAKLRLRWHPDLDVIRTVAEFVNFEVQYVGHQCGSRADWTDANLFYWQISFPFLSVLLCSAWWLLRAGLRRLQHTRRFRAFFGAREDVEVKTVRVVKNKSALASVSHTSSNLVDYVWIKFLMFFVTWYPVLVYTIFTVFTCQADAYGDAYLVHMPEVQCWGSTHWSMVAVACCYIPTVIVAIPVVLGRRLYWGLQADLLNRCSFAECYGWIYSKYKCEFAWWEMVVLLRRALICMCAAFVPVPMVSACLIIFILNLFLCAQLVCSPHVAREIRLLEVGSLFSCMIQAVAGVLLYPSLDKSNECVGSTYLDQLGSICDSNSQYKKAVTIVVLLVFSSNLVVSLILFLRKLHLNRIADAALREIHRVFDLPFDKYDIHLSNVIDGTFLAALLKDDRLRNSPEVRERFVRLNETVPYFVMFNHGLSGLYSQAEYAKTLNRLLESFPGLLDWIAQADRGLVAGLQAFVEDYAAYAREHHNVTFGEIILTAHKADVLMWLMTCNDRHRQAFCRLLLGVASASGMTYFLRPGKIRDQLMETELRHSRVGVKRAPSTAPEDDVPPAGNDATLVDLIRTGGGALATEAELVAAVCGKSD